MWSPSMLVSWSLCSEGERSEAGLVGIIGWEMRGSVEAEKRGGCGIRASTVALQERGCHDDRDQEGKGAWVQRDACSAGVGGVGRTAVGACGHGGGVGVGGGVSPRCHCAVGSSLKNKEKKEDGSKLVQ